MGLVRYTYLKKGKVYTMFLRSNRRFDSIPATPANLLLDRQYQADSVNPAYKSLTPKEKLTVIQLNAVSAVGKLAIVYNEK